MADPTAAHPLGNGGVDSAIQRAGEQFASIDISASSGPILAPPLPTRPEAAGTDHAPSTSSSTLSPSFGLAGPSTTSAMPSRPLSEISENEDRLRSANRLSHHSRSSRSAKDDEKRSSRNTSRPGSLAASRPASLVLEDVSAKRLSGHIQTLTLNLNDYAAAVKRPPSAISNKSRDSLVVSNPPSTPGGGTGRSVSAGAAIGGPSKPERPVLALRTSSISSIKELKKEEDDGIVELGSPSSPSYKDNADFGSETKEGHPLLMAKRASLRPSPLGATYADVLKPTSPTTATSPNPLIATQPFDSTISLASTAPSSADLTPSSSAVSNRPVIKTKSSWLRRASGTAGLRSKSKSPVTNEAVLPASTSLPPALPPRKGLVGSDSETSIEAAKPALPPRKNSYASVAAGSSSRSGLAEGVGRPAYSPPISTIPSRDNITNIRSRITAWTSVSQGGSLPRSDSSATLASVAGSSKQDRFQSSARGMIGTAGSAVQKGWAGLRARGVGGSISSMSALTREEPARSGKARDRSVSAQAQMSTPPDGPVLEGSMIRRQAGYRTCLVFGKDISVVGKEWGVVEEDGIEDREKQRRAVLPAVVVRCVDYLSIWGPKEEGMFRISGRSSHIARLRKEFDSGADLDMADCHPGDLDPHAVSGTLKSYLRELPQPLLTKVLQPRFEAAIRKEAREGEEVEQIADLMAILPAAHWFLLADIVNLLSLIASHQSTNRMTIRALMLSLGPSLNIPGNVFSELVERREELFATPPASNAIGEMADLINFGETKLEPIEIPSSDSYTASSISARPLTPISDNTTPEKPRRSPLLASKPSMTRLFGMSSSSARRGSADTTATTVSSVGLAPPRVEVDTDTPRLPSFDSDPRTSYEFPSSVFSEKPLPLEPIISTTSSTQDAMYKAGTVEDRKRTFSNASSSTPIADMFAGQSKFPSLRPQRSAQNLNGGMTQSTSTPVIGLTGVDALGFATASASAPTTDSGNGASAPGGNGLSGGKSNSAPANPATVIRRGQAGFFGSGDRSDRHVRSHSLASTTASSKVKGANGLMGPPPLPPRADGAEGKRSSEGDKVEMMA